MTEATEASAGAATPLVFVTGTGTGVGKTRVAAALAQGLGAARRVLYWKPVQTGDDDDTEFVRASVTAPLMLAAPAFRFPLPAAPDQAAESAGRPAPTVAELTRQLAALPAAELRLVEGAGGLLVPLNAAGETWADLLSATAAPTLVVAAPGLGTLNHTGLTLRCLEALGVPVVAVVLSGAPHAANAASLRRQHPGVPVLTLPEVTPGTAAWTAAAAELGAAVQARLSALAALAEPGPWLDAARRHVWFPYTQHLGAPEPVAIRRARGVWLTTTAGERLLDATSAWWVNTVGHGRTELGRALARQQQTLDHVLFAGAVHEGAARLAAELAALAGGGLPRVFYSDNGSTAVEVALKIAYQAAVNRGAPERTLFLSFRGSYHGDTYGAMSVARAGAFHAPFAPQLFPTLVAEPVTEQPSRLCPRGAAALPERLAALAAQLEEHQGRLAGVILEPLLMGAGGMLMQPPAFVQGVSALCRRWQVPLILDEVLTGLGRVGAPFAFQRAGVAPDLIAIAKGLTGGTLPLAATLATSALFDAFLSGDKGRALLHGHSFTGNPIACAAARATLAIAATEDLPGRARRLEQRFAAWFGAGGPGAALGLGSPRALGGVLAFELPGSGGGDYFHPGAAALPAVARRHGLFLRPLGNTVYLLPPLTITDDEVEWALARLVRVVDEVGSGG